MWSWMIGRSPKRLRFAHSSAGTPGQARMALIELEGLSKTFPYGMFAVQRASLSLAAGERVVLVGPSCCGKRTTPRMIAGLEVLTSGTLSIDGCVLDATPARDRDLALAFQN